MKLSQITSVGAGATSANVLNGFPEQLLMSPAYVTVLANQAGAAGDITAFYWSGQTPHLGRDGTPVNVAATAGLLDKRTDTLVDRALCYGLQSLYFSSVAAGAVNVQWQFFIPDA